MKRKRRSKKITTNIESPHHQHIHIQTQKKKRNNEIVCTVTASFHTQCTTSYERVKSLSGAFLNNFIFFFFSLSTACTFGFFLVIVIWPNSKIFLLMTTGTAERAAVEAANDDCAVPILLCRYNSPQKN